MRKDILHIRVKLARVKLEHTLRFFLLALIELFSRPHLEDASISAPPTGLNASLPCVLRVFFLFFQAVAPSDAEAERQQWRHRSGAAVAFYGAIVTTSGHIRSSILQRRFANSLLFGPTHCLPACVCVCACGLALTRSTWFSGKAPPVAFGGKSGKNSI